MLEEIVGGVLKGAIDAEGFTDINKCIKDAEEVLADALEAVEDFRKGDLPDIIKGVEEVAKMLLIIKQGM
jgi:hypothetical protein